MYRNQLLITPQAHPVLVIEEQHHYLKKQKIPVDEPEGEIKETEEIEETEGIEEIKAQYNHLLDNIPNI